MDYQYLASGTDMAPTASKFRRATVTQGLCHMTGKAATKPPSDIWQAGEESSLQAADPM